MKATVIPGIISSIVQAFESLFNAPATLACGIIKMISTMAKGIQFFGKSSCRLNKWFKLINFR